MKKILPLALLLATSATFAGPKSLKPAGTGETEDGRSFKKVQVTCSGRKEPRTIVNFEGNWKWCTADEAYCSSKMKAAKRACKQKNVQS
ncbi:MAG: hypothetical protein ACRBBW_00500 [Cellvibrionaceae bacterium]